MLSVLRSKLPLVFKKVMAPSSSLDLLKLYRSKWSFSVAHLSSRSYERLKNGLGDKKRPNPVVPSNSRLKNMVVEGELFSDVSLTQQDINGIITAELPMLSRRDLVQFLFKTVKFSKKNRNIDIVRRNLNAIKVCLSHFPNSSWAGKEIAFIMNSLQAVRSDDAGINELLELLTGIRNVVSRSEAAENKSDWMTKPFF
jgi:hypothetical protein